MLFDEIFKRKEQRKDETKPVRKGKAIKYSEISTPFYELEEHFYYPGKQAVCKHKLDWGEIGDLWTVVEEIGYGMYRDIVTGMVFTYQRLSGDMLKYIMEYPEEYREYKEKIMNNPLAVKKFYSQVPTFRVVPDEYRQLILDETLPRKEEIISKINEVAIEAKKKSEEYLDSMYEKSLEHKIQKLEEEKEEEIRKDKEIETLKKRIEEEKDRIKYEEEMNEIFDSTFRK